MFILHFSMNDSNLWFKKQANEAFLVDVAYDSYAYVMRTHRNVFNCLKF